MLTDMPENASYSKRVVDGLLARKLRGAGAVLVQGAKWCGKTTTCQQIAKSALYMADPKRRRHYLEMADTDIAELLVGEQPRLIDEWQDAPKFWDAIRYDVDRSGGFGHYILTGSAVPPEVDEDDPERREIVHSGTGRIVRLTMRPMSLFESGESSGAVSLGDLFDGKPFAAVAVPERSLRETAHIVCRGGWPMAVMQGGEESLDQAFDYYDAVVSVDVSRVDRTLRDPDRVRRLMRSYARLQGTQSGLKAIRLDMAANDDATLDDNTVASYIKALKKIFVVEDMSAWCPSLRSKAVIRTSDTRYFVDPSIAVAALGVGPSELMEDLRTFGFLFETMAMRDLRCYAEALFGTVYHYHDGSGLECDAVVHLRNGSYGLVEVKLGGDRLVAEGEAVLNALAAKIDTQKMKPPAFKMVITATGDYAYRTRSGALVCPLGCLRF